LLACLTIIVYQRIFVSQKPQGELNYRLSVSSVLVAPASVEHSPTLKECVFLTAGFATLRVLFIKLQSTEAHRFNLYFVIMS